MTPAALSTQGACRGCCQPSGDLRPGSAAGPVVTGWWGPAPRAGRQEAGPQNGPKEQGQPSGNRAPGLHQDRWSLLWLGTDSSLKGTAAHVWPQLLMAMRQLPYVSRPAGEPLEQIQSHQDAGHRLPSGYPLLPDPPICGFLNFFFFFSEEVFFIPCFLRDLNIGKLSFIKGFSVLAEVLLFFFSLLKCSSYYIIDHWVWFCKNSYFSTLCCSFCICHIQPGNYSCKCYIYTQTIN